MAISICFGLLAATVLTLLYVPALYLIVRDVSTLFSKGHRDTQLRDQRIEAG
jgi:hypothetical protein